MIVDHRNRIVFVVDDDASFRKTIGVLLEKCGFRTELYPSAEAFLLNSQFTQASDSCIVLDIQLDGMSGIDLRRRLTRDGHTLPVIFITGNDSEAVRREALQQGCIAYLTKPFPAQAIVDAIDRALA
jgi:FixJ family two-component response regulator